MLGAACLLGLGGAAASSVTQGLVAAYAFDESAGTHGGRRFRERTRRRPRGRRRLRTAGRFGSAASLNGSSARVDLPGLGTFYKAGFTLEAWVKPRVPRST